ncbi:MAG: response regulator [Sandaracinus sp.]
MGLPHVDTWILVVEDDDDLRRMLVTTLAKLGTVVPARSAAEAATFLSSRPPPAVVLTDIMMPGASGLELLRKLRTEARYHGVPVVVLSAKTDPHSIVDGINAGARHYVTKPFKTVDLVTKIERLLVHAAPTIAPPPAPASDDGLELEVVLDEPA